MTDAEMIKALRQAGLAEMAERFEENSKNLKAYKLAYKSASTKLLKYRQIQLKKNW
jgi:hypothetical protein